ncbi:MAG: type II toxin-antitoxin system HicA family toxin, partial [Burkholderiaceae bacterium]|nr:type II toxin-antitoxin system HicA family toxin [Burkholderiaceae bacterium]
MKVHEVLALLKKDGWYLVATRGSHRQFKHPVKIGRVTVAGKPSDDLAPGTLNPDCPLARRPMNDRRIRSIGPKAGEPCALAARHRKQQAALAG